MMKKSILWLVGLFCFTSWAFVACDETEGAPDPYTNWVERNQTYLDSISVVAKANTGDEVGQWKVIHTYKFNPPTTGVEQDVKDYVYCKILEKGTGDISPIFTDTVSAHYRGQLIPLYDGSTFVFDQSYRGELDEDVAIPLLFTVNGVIEGWTTALQEMKEGDRWQLYIPYTLAYGEYGQSSIPGYSTLIFDVSLVDIMTGR